MKVLSFVKSFLVASLLFGVFATAPVSAQDTYIGCQVKMVGGKNSVGEEKSRWTLNSDGTVTGQVKVTGNPDCEQTVTLAAWQAPNGTNGRPYDQQKLVDYKTETFGLGTHSMSIKLPECFYQIDMVKGSNPKGENGGPLYPVEDMLGSLHGGTKTCETPKTPETPRELPKTGAGENMLAIALVTTALGTAYKYLRLRIA